MRLKDCECESEGGFLYLLFLVECRTVRTSFRGPWTVVRPGLCERAEALFEVWRVGWWVAVGMGSPYLLLARHYPSIITSNDNQSSWQSEINPL